MQGGEGKRPMCKFGETCKRMLSGTCTFYHPPNQMGGTGGQSKMGGQGQGGQWGNPNPCKFGDDCKRNLSGNCPYYHPPNQMGGQSKMGGQGQGGQGGNQWGNPNPNSNSFIHHQTKSYPQNEFNSPPMGVGGFKDKNNDIFFNLCRNFHIGQPCQYAENCKKKHYFIVSDENAIRRFNFLRNIPTHLTSKLSKFRSGGKDYFVLRNGNVINFFQFNFQTKALSDVFNWALPELPSNLKYNYYDHKGEYIYYSFPNPQTLIEDMGLFHIPTQKTVHVPHSHSGRITGMAHFNETVLLTTSVAGELKVWIREGETYVTHAESTERLRLSFNPANLKLELLFLDISEVSGTKIIAVGTNDGRLLFFIGNELSFNQVQFKEETYSKVYGVKYTTKPGNPPSPCAVVLLWNNQQTVSTLLQVNLNNFAQEVLVQHQHGPDSSKNTICFFEFVDGYLMVGTLWGELSIYRYPDTNNKVGGIFHQNTVIDVVYCEEELKNTGTKIKYMLILERKTDKREGSLGFYILK